jgi:hypothetical protein
LSSVTRDNEGASRDGWVRRDSKAQLTKLTMTAEAPRGSGRFHRRTRAATHPGATNHSKFLVTRGQPEGRARPRTGGCGTAGAERRPDVGTGHLGGEEGVTRVRPGSRAAPGPGLAPPRPGSSSSPQHGTRPRPGAKGDARGPIRLPQLTLRLPRRPDSGAPEEGLATGLASLRRPRPLWQWLWWWLRGCSRSWPRCETKQPRQLQDRHEPIRFGRVSLV